MTNFYQPDLSSNPENPFARDGDGKLVRRGYWLDMGDRSIVMALSQGIGANLTNDQKKLHLSDSLKKQSGSFHEILANYGFTYDKRNRDS